MATTFNHPASGRPVQSRSGKLLPQGQLDGTSLAKAEQLERHVSKWSVSTRSTSSSDDLNKFDTDDEKRQCSSTDDGADSDDFSEDAFSSQAWETASEGSSCFEESEEAHCASPVSSLLREPPPSGAKDSGLCCRKRLPEENAEVDRSDPRSRSCSAWRPASDGSHASSALVARSVRALLNKLTLEKFYPLYEQLTSHVRTAECVHILLEEVFDKALVQHPFLPMYADLCARLAGDERVAALWPAREASFSQLLMDMCRHCFAQLFAAEDCSGDFASEEARLRRKQRHLGTAKWIGELLTRGLLRSRLLCTCVQQLLEDRQRCPEFVEYAAALLRSAGKTFDVATWEHQPQLQKIFAEIEELSTSASLPRRLRFLLKDLLELRAAGWETARPALKVSEARAAPPRSEPTRPVLTPSARAASVQRGPTAPFDLPAFRHLLTGTLRDLRADRDAKKALGRLKAAAVPRKLQAVEFSDMITRVAEDASGPARRASFAVLLGLSLGEDSAFHSEECIRGTSIFFREVYANLCEEVPRLSMVISSELLPLLRKAWTSVDFNSFLPKELQ